MWLYTSYHHSLLFFFCCMAKSLVGFVPCSCTCCSCLNMRVCFVGKTDTIKIKSNARLPEVSFSSGKGFFWQNVIAVFCLAVTGALFSCLSVLVSILVQTPSNRSNAQMFTTSFHFNCFCCGESCSQ